MGRRAIVCWGVSSFFGWGVYGLNLALHLGRDHDLQIVSALAIDPGQIAIDELRWQALAPFMENSKAFQTGMRFGRRPTDDDVVLSAMGNDMQPMPGFEAFKRIAVVFFEYELEAEAAERVREQRLVIAGSTWNERLLRAYGVESVATVFQGVDPTLYHPAPRTGLFGDRFLIFSGGKAEARKSQDLVLAAFRRFSARRADATLVTAWHSPWPQGAQTLDPSSVAAPVRFTPQGQLDVRSWAGDCGIDPARVIDLGAIPNVLFAGVVREMDVALFPNRAEGGTNLVAMECMACGVPVILSQNTGHLDLIADGSSYVLSRQGPSALGPATIQGVDAWGESDVDEMVEALEQAYVDRAEARRRGLEGAKLVSQFTWARTAQRMKEIVLAF